MIMIIKARSNVTQTHPLTLIRLFLPSEFVLNTMLFKPVQMIKIFSRQYRASRRQFSLFRSCRYRSLYSKVKGNEFKNKRVLMEHIFKAKEEADRVKHLHTEVLYFIEWWCQ